MAEHTTEVLVGAGVLAAAIGFVVYAGQISGYAGGASTYPLEASFRSLEGVNVGSDVRLAGVKIGTVSEVMLNAETYRADTTVSLNAGIEIPDDSAIIISSEGLLGGNFVEIVPGGSPYFYAAGDQIEDTQGAVSLVSLLLKFVGGSSE
ncbi:outer membrane lipid asymmetry maintenance protein MlaD [Roseobacter denitrificans]|uniref:Mce-related protein, putative n=1 Tax=Roseobacter denitrificans (strain ATCC 33942 / OCh 114) TaxID=375451 RepID=Q165G3_ROSDO|nr:outer membrane lipid asymmetry maintenance protein MlaD [Roseobacter denitrificans]ABG32380.1 mce-related protein, putative [Roseobacter denitrificans OCh 114]AVL51852.1 outer membrane lipid asymmetry maintenance protein MlaD [Roseobacter denitrificans]SFF81071.1 phospholipid/cholesterol/gamma-HCH transport system substrate-binding protein [Roseobacter denitrificans OCh 114]